MPDDAFMTTHPHFVRKKKYHTDQTNLLSLIQIYTLIYQKKKKELVVQSKIKRKYVLWKQNKQEENAIKIFLRNMTKEILEKMLQNILNVNP